MAVVVRASRGSGDGQAPETSEWRTVERRSGRTRGTTRLARPLPRAWWGSCRSREEPRSVVYALERVLPLTKLVLVVVVRIRL